MFHDRLDVALAQARRTNARVGVMFLDLDRFKSINDSLGHTVGNQLLQRVAERLQLCVRAADTVARMGGDEFMVLLPSIDGTRDCTTVAEKLLQAFAEPFSVGSRELVTSTSIGIAMFPDNGEDADTLAKNADVAMYRAKSEGRNRFQTYTPDMTARAQVKLSLESSLRIALESDALELYYQPKIDTKTHEIVGLEALARWQHRDFGFVPPTAFIPLAEESGLIVPLGEWVLESACAQIRQWSDTADLLIPVAINLSAREFTHTRVDTRIAAALERHHLSPDLLQLEITESIFMHDLGAAREALINLRNMGVRCSIDDFGTGYSGLTYLSQLPIYSLKIDQSFIQKIGFSPNGDRIVDAVIALARGLNMRVIAEGVETEGQATFLFSHGCDEMQGLLFCPPLSAGALTEQLGSWSDPSSPHEARPLRAATVVPTNQAIRAEEVTRLLQALCTNQSIAASDEAGIPGVLAALHARERTTAPPSGSRPDLRRAAGRAWETWSPWYAELAAEKALPALAPGNG
jgi:diguanylate cyclase (GGDEF)-like protein